MNRLRELNSINRIRLELNQYGITPRKCIQRFKAKNNDVRILANSIPKSGTNLLSRALYLVPEMRRHFSKTIDENSGSRIFNKLRALKGNEFLVAHLPYQNEIDRVIEEEKISHILVVRDPRDIVVSNYDYLMKKDVGHRLYNCLNEQYSNEHERLMALITGISEEVIGDGKRSRSLDEHISEYSKWLNSRAILVVKFEDLVGPNGGGSHEKQVNALASIYNFCNMELDINELADVADQLYSPSSRTFNKGQIGIWRKRLSGDHLGALGDSTIKLLNQFGYCE